MHVLPQCGRMLRTHGCTPAAQVADGALLRPFTAFVHVALFVVDEFVIAKIVPGNRHASQTAVGTARKTPSRTEKNIQEQNPRAMGARSCVQNSVAVWCPLQRRTTLVQRWQHAC